MKCEKPKKGFEPLTPALRKRCSTVELLRRPRREYDKPRGAHGIIRTAGAFSSAAEGGRGAEPGAAAQYSPGGAIDCAPLPAYLSGDCRLQALAVQLSAYAAHEVPQRGLTVVAADPAAEVAGTVADGRPQFEMAAAAPHRDREDEIPQSLPELEAAAEPSH